MSASASLLPCSHRDAGSKQGCSMAGEHPTAQLGPWVLNCCCFRNSSFGILDCTCYPSCRDRLQAEVPPLSLILGEWCFSINFTMSCSVFLKSFKVFLNSFQIYLFSLKTLYYQEVELIALYFGKHTLKCSSFLS